MAISEKKLEEWARKHDLKKLHKALLEYDYKVRIEAAKHLGGLKSRESLPHLEKLIDDSFIAVVRQAEKAIRSISSSHESLSAFVDKVAQMEKVNEKQAARTAEKFTPPTEEDERKKLEEVAKRVSIAKIYQEELKEERVQNNHWKWAITVLGLVALVLALLYF